MVPCYSYGIYRRKEVGGTLYSSFGVAMQPTQRGIIFMAKGEFSLCNTAVLKLYCKYYWVL